MVDEQKQALRQLQKKIIEVIREIELGEVLSGRSLIFITDDYEFQLEYSRKLKRFLVLIKEE